MRRYAATLLAVFVVGGMLLPFAHEFTHIRQLEHRHGDSAADFSLIAVGPGGVDAVDFLVEERTVPHNPDCDLCARLSLDVPAVIESVTALAQVDGSLLPNGTPLCGRTSSHSQIRAPPLAS